MAYEVGVILSGAVLAAMVSGSSGFAFGLIASAIWLHVLAPSQVVPLVVICSMLVNAALVWRLRGMVRLRLLWPFLAGAMIGVPIGVAALHRLDGHVVRQAVGVGLRLWLPGLALWLVGHALAVWGGRVDPQFVPVFARHLKQRVLLDV